MKPDVATAKATISHARTGWNRYLTTLAVLNLLFAIDYLTGEEFFLDQENISILDLDLPRIAFSFTYSVLFGVFVIWAISSSRLTHEIVCNRCDDDTRKKLLVTPEYVIWILSPINLNRNARIAFWIIAADGVIILSAVTFIHLFDIMTPDESNMVAGTYKTIGVLSAAILALSLFAASYWIYPSWAAVYKSLRNASRST